MCCDGQQRLAAAALRVAHHRYRLVWIGDGRGATCVVDHVENATGPSRGEENCEQVMEARPRKGGGDLKRARSKDVHALIEEALAAHTVSAEICCTGGNLEGGP